MNNKLLKVILLLVIATTLLPIEAKTIKIKRVYNAPREDADYCCPYIEDLEKIERYLFGRIYSKEAPGLRLNRIEESLFNKTYPTMNIAQRMNRALENYRDDYYNRNYLTQYSNVSGIGNRIRNRFYGQPTGFTPQIMNTTFSSGGFMPGLGFGSASNRSYRYGNFIPGNMGAGVTILD